ncbi:hypothetical protein CEXT_196621 [Caerostris extrusa]|uniref:Uncharacterized protein n=1 Tax=Caerostris extrusa TaxID=172846 RepID=A0AAV4S8G3_CAEEX|nr:hypothetical protein CEXT_196621 [Caerostris extrusa]
MNSISSGYEKAYKVSIFCESVASMDRSAHLIRCLLNGWMQVEEFQECSSATLPHANDDALGRRRLVRGIEPVLSCFPPSPLERKHKTIVKSIQNRMTIRSS